MVAYTSLACQFAIGLAFAISGISKVAGRKAFAEFVASVGTLARVPLRWRAPLAGVVVAAVGATLLLTGPAGATDPGGVVVAGAAGGVLAAVLIRFDDLLSVFTSF